MSQKFKTPVDEKGWSQHRDLQPVGLVGPDGKQVDVDGSPFRQRTTRRGASWGEPAVPPTRIFLYTDTPIAGGAEMHMQLLAKNLLSNGYQVKVICSSYPSLDEWCSKMEKDGIQVLRLKVKHKHDPAHYFQLKKIVKEETPDILHLHLWNPGACRYAFWTIDRAKTKIVTTEHDPFQLSGIKRLFKKLTIRRTDSTIAVSKENEAKILAWYPLLEGKTSVIHNGIDLKAFERPIINFSQQEKKKMRLQLFDAQNEDFVILTIAALHPRKGLIHLIDAFAEVLKLNPESKLIIVGEGPQKKLLEKKIQKLKLTASVKMLHHQDKIAQILKCSDLFVLPSIKEAFGLVLLEAMAAKTPIIASKVGGIPEIIQDHQNGWLVEPANSKLLAEKIINLLKNKPLREKLAFIGHHDVQKFDVKIMVEKTENVYADVRS